MIYTTLNRIKDKSPCSEGWKKLLRGLDKSTGDDELVGFDQILKINGQDDAFWCLRAEPQHNRLWRALAVRCARDAQHIMRDARSIAALDVADAHARGLASDGELVAARAAAWDAARTAACDAACDAARAAAWGAAWAAARAARAAAAGAEAAAGAKFGEYLLHAASSFHAAPGELGEPI